MNARPAAPRPAFSTRRRTRGGVLGWLVGALVFGAALAVLAWMLLLAGLAQARFAAGTGGAELRLRGLMGDPFAGRATVTGWTLRVSADPKSPVLARGAASEIVSSGWQAALGITGPGKGPVVIDKLVLTATELVLAPDAQGRWPLLALGASAGLPYERGGKTGDGPRVRIQHLKLNVDTVIVRDAATGRTLQRAAEIGTGQALSLQFHDGEIGAQAGPAARSD